MTWLHGSRWPKFAAIFATAALAGSRSGPRRSPMSTRMKIRDLPRRAGCTPNILRQPSHGGIVGSLDAGRVDARSYSRRRAYSIVSLDMYGDRDQNIVADYLYQQLQTADYVVLASNRVVVGVNQLSVALSGPDSLLRPSEYRGARLSEGCGLSFRPRHRSVPNKRSKGRRIVSQLRPTRGFDLQEVDACRPPDVRRADGDRG